MNIEELIGKTFVRVTNNDDDNIVFACADGKEYVMEHFQDCCEHVSVESIVGDLGDLVGSPILRAEEVTSNEHPAGHVANEYEDSFTWTFYKLATQKGYVDIRWFGSSNGYYSESVRLHERGKGRWDD